MGHKVQLMSFTTCFLLNRFWPLLPRFKMPPNSFPKRYNTTANSFLKHYNTPANSFPPKPLQYSCQLLPKTLQYANSLRKNYNTPVNSFQNFTILLPTHTKNLAIFLPTSPHTLKYSYKLPTRSQNFTILMTFSAILCDMFMRLHSWSFWAMKQIFCNNKQYLHQKTKLHNKALTALEKR